MPACRHVGAVVALFMHRPTRVEVRRLQLAAEQGGGVGILLRPNLINSGSNIYAAATRWLVSPALESERFSDGAFNKFTARDGGHPSSWRNTVQQGRQILCIHLPQWSITRCCRRHPEYHNSATVIIRTAAQRRQVVEASERAKKMGVRAGMSVAEARALCGKLNCVEQDLMADHRALSALGRWLMRFTPDVANGWDGADENAPTALFLDLTGCERLFGGIDPIVHQAKQALVEFNIPAQMAVAPTPGMAWAFAFSLCNEITKLPVLTLRLEQAIFINLHRLGLRHVGELLVIPHQLLARFGSTILLRLDQLTGDRVEQLTRLITSVPITARMDFDAPIEALEEIQLVFEKLLDGVLKELASRGRGVRQLRMILKPDAGWGKPIIMRKIVLCAPIGIAVRWSR